MHGEGDVQQVAAPTDAAVGVCKTGNSSLAFQTLVAPLEKHVYSAFLISTIGTLEEREALE